jgi:beta-lactamase class A
MDKLMARLLVLLGAFLSAALSGPAQAQPLSASDPGAALTRLFTEPTVQADWFDEALLAAVPAEQIEAIVDGLSAGFGPLRAVTEDGGKYTVELERADIPTDIALDPEGRIVALLFGGVVPHGTVEEHVAAIAALPGETSVLVISDGEVTASHRPDATLAVGSVAKLAILKAVNYSVDNGALAWDQVVPFEDSWRSVGSGQIHAWPEGTPLTIGTLANLMVSISDNTATDALIDIVGRRAIEPLTPRNAPFLTTHELFKLKAVENEAERSTWVSGGFAERAEVLDRLLDVPLPGAQSAGRVTLDVEWFMSATEICAFLDELAGLEAMHINPGLANPTDWQEIAYKGGSEPGLLALATAVTDAGGTDHCVVAVWNDDAPLTDALLEAPYRGILRALASS